MSNAPDSEGNQPFEPAYLEEWASVPSSSTQAKYRTGKWTPNSAIHPLNKRFGRKLEIVSFRWISQAEMNS